MSNRSKAIAWEKSILRTLWLYFASKHLKSDCDDILPQNTWKVSSKYICNQYWGHCDDILTQKPPEKWARGEGRWSCRSLCPESAVGSLPFLGPDIGSVSAKIHHMVDIFWPLPWLARLLCTRPASAEPAVQAPGSAQSPCNCDHQDNYCDHHYHEDDYCDHHYHEDNYRIVIIIIMISW